MTDRLTKERRSWLMSRIRGKDTSPEVALRRALYASGLRGWRIHSKALPGRPDVAFPRWRVAVFVDGAFWHGHPSKFSPGRLSEDWERKILANQARDRRVDSELRGLGWKVVRIWDEDIRRDIEGVTKRVYEALVAQGHPAGISGT